MVGFFLQIVIVSLCSLVLLMLMVRDRHRALGRGKGSIIEKEGLAQNDRSLVEGEEVQELYRGDDGARV